LTLLVVESAAPACRASTYFNRISPGRRMDRLNTGMENLNLRHCGAGAGLLAHAICGMALTNCLPVIAGGSGRPSWR
jgi:hypothetical protein